VYLHNCDYQFKHEWIFKLLTADTTAAAEWADRRTQMDPSGLEAMATDVRRSVVTMVDRAGLGHIGGDLSVTDILVTLFGAVLDVDPADPARPERDRFILSKGHCAGALYATLAHCGFFSRDELATFMAPLSALNGHPNRTKVPGVETNTGPLGHGFPVGVGCALAAKLRGLGYRTFVVLGDGELQEGSNWEAAMTAAHYDLDNLTAIVDRNRLQQGASTADTKELEPLPEKWAAFGFEVRVTDGHDHAALLEALAPSTTGRPVAVIANTIKGKGISFMEDRVEWHHKVPSPEQVQIALQELSQP
jgi:transketolase